MIAATRLIDKSMGIDLLPCQHKIIIKKKNLNTSCQSKMIETSSFFFFILYIVAAIKQNLFQN